MSGISGSVEQMTQGHLRNVQQLAVFYTGHNNIYAINIAKVKAFIITEEVAINDTPKDTKEEAIETKNITKNEKVILVTSASHMKRAVKLFEKEGLNVIASPTEHRAYSNTYPSSYFNSNNLKKVELAFHEHIGIIYSKIKGEI